MSHLHPLPLASFWGPGTESPMSSLLAGPSPRPLLLIVLSRDHPPCLVAGGWWLVAWAGSTGLSLVVVVADQQVAAGPSPVPGGTGAARQMWGLCGAMKAGAGPAGSGVADMRPRPSPRASNLCLFLPHLCSYTFVPCK